MRRLQWILILIISAVALNCSRARTDDPNARERELQKRAQQQHEAEEKAAREKGTDNASSIKRYKGPDTRPNPKQNNKKGDSPQ
jgi:hypothetical protein